MAIMLHNRSLYGSLPFCAAAVYNTENRTGAVVLSLATFDKGKKAKTVFETKTAHSHAVL